MGVSDRVQRGPPGPPKFTLSVTYQQHLGGILKPKAAAKGSPVCMASVRTERLARAPRPALCILVEFRVGSKKRWPRAKRTHLIPYGVWKTPGFVGEKGQGDSALSSSWVWEYRTSSCWSTTGAEGCLWKARS